MILCVNVSGNVGAVGTIIIVVVRGGIIVVLVAGVVSIASMCAMVMCWRR